MLCVKAHYKLKIEIFCFICVSLGFVLIKDNVNRKRVYLKFVAAQLRVCDCNQLQHSNCSLKLERSVEYVEYLGFMYTALENFKTME